MSIKLNSDTIYRILGGQENFEYHFASSGYAIRGENLNLNNENHYTMTYFYILIEDIHNNEPFLEDKKLTQLKKHLQKREHIY